MSRAIAVLSFAVWLFGSVAVVQATGYYVSNSGSDSAVGTSSSAPWASLTKVNSFPFVPGDTIYFNRGDTWIGLLSISRSGTASQLITYSAYGGGQKPIISNSGSYSRSVYITASWIVVDGLLLRDSTEAGVRINSPGANNVVSNCEITAVGEGVLVANSNNNLITGNVIHDNKMVVNTPTPTNDDYGDNGVVIDTGLNNEVSYNTIYNCVAPSYDYGTDGGAFELYGTTDGTYIHHNNVYENNGVLEMGAPSISDTANNVVVAYNVMRNNLQGGGVIYAHNSGTFGVMVDNLRIENNTIVETKYTSGKILGSSASPPSGMLSFTNNIVYLTASGVNFSNYAFTTRSHNLYNVLPGSFLGGLQAGEIVGDPLFSNSQANDYHLQEPSPAIDKGLALGYLKDFDGNTVPFGSAPDIGAYEWSGGPNTLDLPKNIRIIN